MNECVYNYWTRICTVYLKCHASASKFRLLIQVLILLFCICFIFISSFIVCTVLFPVFLDNTVSCITFSSFFILFLIGTVSELSFCPYTMPLHIFLQNCCLLHVSSSPSFVSVFFCVFTVLFCPTHS